MRNLQRQGTMLIGVRLLLMTASCAEAVAPTPDHHQVSPVSAELGDVVEVHLGSSAEVFCQLQPSHALSESCISVQTKDPGKEKSRPLFLSNPEQKVEVTEQVLLYLYEGQEKPEHRSLMYQNRTRRLRGGDIGVEILNISASDNNTIIQCMECPGCGSCNLKREITMRVVERAEDQRLITHFTIQPTTPGKAVAVTVAPVVVIIVIVIFIISGVSACTLRRRANAGTYEVAEGRQMAAVERGIVANGGVGRTPAQSGWIQDHLNGTPGTTQHQQNGSAVMTQHHYESTVTTQHQQNGLATREQPQQNGLAARDHQNQQNGSAVMTQPQQNGLSVTTQPQQNGSAVSTEVSEQESLLRNRDSDGEEGQSSQSN